MGPISNQAAKMLPKPIIASGDANIALLWEPCIRVRLGCKNTHNAWTLSVCAIYNSVHCNNCDDESYCETHPYLCGSTLTHLCTYGDTQLVTQHLLGGGGSPAPDFSNNLSVLYHLLGYCHKLAIWGKSWVSHKIKMEYIM